MKTIETGYSLSLSREFTAAPQTVWRCLTEANLLARWFAPAPVTVTRAEIEPRPGGIFHVVMQVPDMGEMDGGAGCILLAEPRLDSGPNSGSASDWRLVWTSALGPGFAPVIAPEGDGFAFTADIRLYETTSGCRYDVTALQATEKDRTAHEMMGFEAGWGACADQLGRLAHEI